jgi:nucleoid DNA-binding protein
VIENDQVRIPNFGIFSKAISKEKTLKSIQTKEVYQVPAKFRATFKVSSVLRAKVSELPLPSGVTVAKK